MDLGDTYSPVKAASRFLGDDLDVIIDLHGHTLHSGLPLLAHPSLSHILRLSFCGWPQTTGASFIDHMVADKVVAVPEQASREFTEKLIMLPESYLPADHANLVGSVLTRPRATAEDVNHTSDFAFGSLSSFQKLDSSVFDVWANILRRSSKRSVLRLMRTLYMTSRNLDCARNWRREASILQDWNSRPWPPGSTMSGRRPTWT